MAQLVFPIASGADDQRVYTLASPDYPPSGTVFHEISNSVLSTNKDNTGGTNAFRIGSTLLKWNTASLPDNSVISSVQLRVQIFDKGSPGNRNWTAGWSAWDGASDSDLSAIPEITALDVPISSLVIGTQQTFTLANPQNVNETGTTYLRFFISGGQPIGAQDNYVTIAAFEDPTAPAAELIVNYTVPQPPVANFTVSGTGLTRTFNNTSSDPDGTIASSLWNFGDSSATVTTTSPTHQFPGNGTYAVKLTVTDNTGLTNTKTTNVVINAPGPQASFTVSGTGLTRTFQNTSTSNVAVVSSTFNFGDGSPVFTGQSPVNHKYVPGSYTVVLTVKDFEGQTGVKSQVVVIGTPAAPPTPTWKNLSQFQVVPTNFTFQGNIPISTTDSPISMVHLQIARTDTSAMAYDAEFEVTPEERTQGYWARAPVALDPAVTYRTKFRTKDTYNQYSPFSLERTFDVSIGPDPPSLTAPLGKINVISGFSYQGTYSHPDLLSANAAQIELRTPAGTTIIYDSGTLAISVANGAAWSIAEFHPDLSWATKYTWKARLRDSANAWGPYSLLRAFNTNSPPSAPTSLSPASGSATDSRVFSCALSDPDGDPITAAQIEISNASTGAIIAGYPKQMTVSADSTTATFTAPTTDLSLGTQYKFRCRATDGFSPGYGGWSVYSTVRYQTGPKVALLSPSPAQRRNLVLEPSAEYARGTYWTEVGRGGLTDKNLLTANQSTPEIDLTGWTPQTSIVTRSSSYAAYGTYSVALTCSLAGETAVPRIHLTLPNAPLPNTDYSWQVSIYLPVDTYLNLNLWSLRENAASGATLARASDVNAPVLYEAGWHTMSGSGTTTASPGTAMVLYLTHARKADNSSYDSTKTIYFDKAQVEFGLTSTVWDLGSSGAPAGYIEIVDDGDAAFGSASWRARESEASANAFRGQLHAINSSKPFFVRAAFKKESGSSATHLKVLCYNNTGTLLGTLYPSSIGAANGTNVPPYWQYYGGIIWPVGSVNAPAFISSTGQIRIEIVPSAAQVADVRFDAIQLEEVPLIPGSVVIDWARLQTSFGYFDGEEPGERYGPSGYRWTGLPGASQSVGLNVQTSPSMFALTTYTSPGGAKAKDRLTIEVYDPTSASFILVNAPTWVASNRTFIPLPAGVLRNEKRYRLLVEAEDAAGAVGNSGYVEFDTVFDGPIELPILVATPNPESATIDLVFQPTALPATQFDGIEVMARPTDDSEPAAIFAVIKDTGTTRVSYHFPVSGKEYELSVKQKRITGLDSVGSRWNRARVTCTYPYPILKDAEDPSLYVAYDVPPQSYEQDAPGEVFFPWGSTVPVHLLGEIRVKSGKEEIALYEELGLVASAEQRWPILKEILQRRRTICLLMQTPEPTKVFGAIIGKASFGLDDLKKKVVSFDWEETFYPEDLYERGEQ